MLASPPSISYRARKFVRRHTGGVSVAAAGLLVLVGFAVTMTVQAGRMAAERDRAHAEAARANREAEAKGQVSAFLKDPFTVSDPSEARGNSITARELLDKGAEKIEGMPVEQPETGAELMATIGDVYRELGLFSQAEPLLHEALETTRRVHGDDHPNAGFPVHNLACLYRDVGDTDESQRCFKRAQRIWETKLRPDHPLVAENLLVRCRREQNEAHRARALLPDQ